MFIRKVYECTNCRQQFIKGGHFCPNCNHRKSVEVVTRIVYKNELPQGLILPRKKDSTDEKLQMV